MNALDMLWLADVGFSPSNISGLKAWYSANYGVYQDGAAHFTAASSQKATIASNASLTFANTDFFISIWSKHDTTPSAQDLLTKYTANAPGAAEFVISAQVTMSFNVWDAALGNKVVFATNAGNLATNTWYNTQVWFDNTAKLAWISVNGSTPQSVSVPNGITASGASISLGGGGWNGYMNGSLDEAFITKRIPSAAERAWLYNSGNGQVFANVASGMPSLNDASAVSWWSCNEESGTRFDSIGTNDLTASNTVLISPTVNNGGFESDTGGTIASPWNTFVAGTSSVTDETSIVHSGSHAAKLTADASSNVAELYQNTTLGLYSYSFWTRSASGTPTLNLGDGTNPYVTVTLSTTYTQFTGTYQSVAATFPLFIFSRASNSAYIDDVTITDLGPVGIAGIAAGVAADGNFCGNFVASSSQSLTIADNSSLRCGDIDFAFLGWIYVSSEADERAVLGKSNGGGGEYLIDLVGANLSFYSGSTVVAVSVPELESWYFFTVWRDSTAGTINIAIQEENPSSASSTASAPGVTNFAIGSYPNGAHPFDGRIDSILFCKNPPGGIAGIISTIRSTLFNKGNGLKAKNLTTGQIAAWGVVSGWDMDKQLGITADSIGTNTLTNNNAVTFAQGVDYFGGAVSKQLDHSSAANNVVQVTEALRPVWYSGVQNNKPGILYNGVSNLLEDASASGIPVGTSARTVFQVIKQTTVQNGFPLFWNAGAANHCGININGTFKAYLEDYYDSGISISNNTAYIVAFTYDGTNLATYVNDVAGATFTPTPPIHTGTVDLSLGAISGGVIPFSGYAFDGAIYNSALTRAQITQVFNYFKQQWGIS